uniref:Uncharacterized protein n=1 Tax=Ciona savignyi TaxID=51511 RepID=H2YWT0_CIOSA
KSGVLNEPIQSCAQFWLNKKTILLFINGNQKHEPKLSNPNKPFLDHFVQILESSKHNDKICVEFTSALNHSEFLIHCLTYSPAPTKDNKSTNQAILHALTLDDAFSPNSFTSADTEVNLTAIEVLFNLEPNNIDHQTFGWVQLEKLLNFDQTITQSKPRQHFNSPTHLVRQKTWQSLILLLRFVPKDKSLGLVSELAQRLAQDMQASVRHLMEWSLALLVFRFPATESVVFGILNSNVQGKKCPVFSSICSCLTIALLVGLCKVKTQSFEIWDRYFSNLINAAIPWCMTQHFSVRLYASAVLLRGKILYSDHGRY